MNDFTILAVQLGLVVAAFVVGKYVFPNIPKSVTDKLATLSQWAAKFVEWAKEFMKKQTGEEKMAAVVEKLKEIADEAGIEVTEDQLRAIAQSAYNAMKAGEKEAAAADETLATYYKIGERAAAKGSTVNIYTAAPEKVAVATDEVPEGALEDNEDGTVNVYDAAGKKTGTVTAEEAAAAAEGVTQIELE
ncbi:MAG: phage holin family protein [Ruminococcus sp.]|nr:phage holin family protein [Ruminococcus sp.]